jgi:hypothetical protein
MFQKKNRKLILILALTTALLLAISSIAMAAVWTDQADYSPGSVVTINGDNSDGAGYLAGETVVVEVLGPNGYNESCNPAPVADGEGAWSCQVMLWDSDLAVGEYSYTATGQTSGVSQSGMFTDAQADIYGTVRDLSNNTLSGVLISASPCNSQCTAFTSTDGSYHITPHWGTGSPTITFTASIEGYNSSSISFSVSNNQDYYNKDFTLTATCTPPAVITSPSNANITYGSNASFTVAGTNYTSVQWQVSTDGGTNWSNISSANSETYSLTKPAVSMSGYKYHAILSSSSCTPAATSSVATLTVHPAPVTMTAGSYSGTYDGSSHAPSDCAVSGDYTGALSCTNNPASVGPNVGLGAVTPVLVLNGETASNFDVTSENGSWAITPAPVTITAGDYSGTYDGSSHAPSDCAVSGDYTGALSCTNNPASVGPNVGSGAVTPVLVLNGETASNFTVTSVNGSWSISKADAICTIIGYSVYFDNSNHTATGSCKGVLGELLSGLDLSGTTHILVGTYNDTWTFIDVTGNYYDSSGTVADKIMAWTLNGFFQPVDMNGVYNRVKGGSTVPLKFKIFAGTTELTDVAFVTSLQAEQVVCDAGAFIDDVEIVATGGTVLRYSDGQFIYNWKTPSGAGKCFRVTMTTLDGSSLVAYFKLK